MTSNVQGSSTRSWQRILCAGATACLFVTAIVTGCGGSDGPRAAAQDVSGSNPDGGAASTLDGGPSNQPGAPQDQSPADAGPDVVVEAGPPVIECNTLKAGKNTLTVNNATRTFHIQLPTDPTKKMALLFLWHGWMQDPVKFANEVVYDVPKGKWVPFDPNAFEMPLMIVTPVDTKLIPPWGLDWDIVSGERDFGFFEGMLKCIERQYTLEDKRIYSFGFSAGAVFTNLLSARYPNFFAATISESGAWFNDVEQQKEVLVPMMQWKWPAFDPADRGNVLLTHGGPNDFATVISLEKAAQKALPYLKAHGRTVVECGHTVFGHTLDPDLTQKMLYDYLWSHERGEPALTALVPGFPTPAQPVGDTRCTFREPTL